MYRSLIVTSLFLSQGYLPQSLGRRVEVLSRKRQEYHIWVQEHYDVDDIDKSEDELRILHQIRIDAAHRSTWISPKQKTAVSESKCDTLFSAR